MRTLILFVVLTTYIAQFDRNPHVNMVRKPNVTVSTYSQFAGTNVLRRRGHQSSALLHPATLKTILYVIPTKRCSSASLSLTQSYYLQIWTQICLHMSGDQNIMFNIYVNTWSVTKLHAPEVSSSEPHIHTINMQLKHSPHSFLHPILKPSYIVLNIPVYPVDATHS